MDLRGGDPSQALTRLAMKMRESEPVHGRFDVEQMRGIGPRLSLVYWEIGAATENHSLESVPFMRLGRLGKCPSPQFYRDHGFVAPPRRVHEIVLPAPTT